MGGVVLVVGQVHVVVVGGVIPVVAQRGRGHVRRLHLGEECLYMYFCHATSPNGTSELAQ